MKPKYWLFGVLLLPLLNLRAQDGGGLEKLMKNELRLKHNESGSAWTRFTFSTQFWSRYTNLNAGSLDASGQPAGSEFDFALRRTRFSLQTNFDDRVVLYTQLGFNGLSAVSAKPQIFFHDVWAMLRIAPQQCYIGFGLNGWNGISRLSSVSSQKTMTLDHPGFNYPNINRADIESRQLGVFMKGTVSRISYRAAIAKPFAYNGVPNEPQSDTAYEFPSAKLSYKAYAAFHFLDKEYFNTPYLDMTYIGAKKIFNLGAGFDFHPRSIAEYNAETVRELKNKLHLGADIFIELPMVQNRTFTLYSVFYYNDFGNNYLRASGTMNQWSGGTGMEGAGNNEFKMGTGNIWYTTAGYLFRNDFLKIPGRIQCFYAFTHKNFEALQTPLFNHDIGLNYFLAGQKLKFSLQYSLRPILNDSASTISRYRDAFILQIQVAI